jgi:hypothetical protein
MDVFHHPAQEERDGASLLLTADPTAPLLLFPILMLAVFHF